MFRQKVGDWLYDATNQLALDLGKEINFNIIVNAGKSEVHGDFACNIALVLAKAWSMPAIEIANAIISCEVPGFIEKCWVANPGFINVKICPEHIKKYFNTSLFEVKLEKQTIVLDYSAPNLAKSLHVGHLRTTIIGDALARINAFIGHDVIRQNHVGDWGTQFGMILAYMEHMKYSPDQLINDIDELEFIYKSAKKMFDESSDFANKAREFVVKLQSSEPKSKNFWRMFRQVSLMHCQELYDRLGLLLTFDDVVGESFYHDKLSELIVDLKEQKLLTESDGAICYFSENHLDKDDKPLPIILQKQGGGYLYATTDLAAARYRIQCLHADKVLYVVDQRQALHFSMLFELVAKCSWNNDSCQLQHIGFGTINDANGRPFKTREGGTIKLKALLDEAVSRAKILVSSKQPDISAAELDDLANKLAIASIKYNDLSKIRTNDYAFSYENMLKFEGNTAPYILYAYVRLSKLSHKNDAVKWNFSDPVELQIAKHIITFPDVVKQAAIESMPHYICNYLYELSVLAMKFYEICPINTAEDPIKNERMAMSHMISSALSVGLSLLGIDTIARM